MEVALAATACAICASDEAEELYAANFDAGAFNPEVFTQRRLPDRVHYRMVRCSGCGLVRADPAASAESLIPLYRASGGTSAEADNLRRTYGRYLARVDPHQARRGDLLEIGCGTGLLLEEALAMGYRTVTGVEPSGEAAAAASPNVRESIVSDVMRTGLFEPESFDVVCLFQVFDHIAEPNAMLAECHRILRPGGVILALNHNVDSITNRLLGERSPIVDIEHTYLYGPSTMARIFAKNGFTTLEAGRVWNDYSLGYLAHLAPLPRSLKRPLLDRLGGVAAGRIRLRVPLGNLFLVAQKPPARATKETT